MCKFENGYTGAGALQLKPWVENYEIASWQRLVILIKKGLTADAVAETLPTPYGVGAVATSNPPV